MLDLQKENWREVELDDVVSFKTGKLNSNAKVEDGDYPFFTCAPETFSTNTFSFDTEAVILAGNNANGIYSIKYFNGKFDAYQRTYIIEPLKNSQLNTKYLYYALSLKLNLLQNVSVGSTTKFLTKKILNNLKISVPPLSAQKYLINNIGSYDNLIKNNKKRIEILEKMAQAIYNKWFVQFEFPGAKEVKMVDSGTRFGEIPEGWEVKRMGEFFEINYGDNLAKKDTLECGEYPVYAANGVVGYYNELVSEEKVTLVSCRGAKSGKVLRTRESAFVTNNSLIITPKEEYNYMNYVFIFQLLKNMSLKSAVTGSAQPQITISSLSPAKVLVPNKGLVKKYTNLCERKYELEDLLKKENKKLKETRDLLLKKLI